MKQFLQCITMLCLSAMALNAQTITWTGAGDGTNWSDPNNWNLLAIPTIDNDVIIPQASTITINNHVLIKSITVNENSVITLNDGISFTEPSSFEDNVIVNWHFGAIANYYPSFGVAFTNKGTININRLTPSFNAPQFWGTTFNNEGVVNLIYGYLIISGGLVNNQTTGIIDIQSDESGIAGGIDGIGPIYNYGIVKKTIGTGESRICPIMENFGTIEILTGELYFCDYSYISLNNRTEGTIKGTGTFNVSQLAGYSNSGTFEPGASPGTLTFIGDFTSTAASKLGIELNGLTQGPEYDLLVIEGNAIFNGIVNVTMGFEGSLNDEFIVATTTGTITECNLAPVATAAYNGNIYDFTVACRNNNEVVLTIASITLDIDSNEFTDKNIQLFPNPVRNSFTLRNNSNQELKSASIIDLNGRVVKEIDLKGMLKEKVISLRTYDTGIYLIKVISNNNSIIKKIVKL